MAKSRLRPVRPAIVNRTVALSRWRSVRRASASSRTVTRTTTSPAPSPACARSVRSHRHRPGAPHDLDHPISEGSRPAGWGPLMRSDHLFYRDPLSLKGDPFFPAATSADGTRFSGPFFRGTRFCSFGPITCARHLVGLHFLASQKRSSGRPPRGPPMRAFGDVDVRQRRDGLRTAGLLAPRVAPESATEQTNPTTTNRISGQSF
jgi:hypothetical protein